MKVLEDKQVERLITLEFTEAELREIQNMASYYHLRASAAIGPAARLRDKLESLNLGERRGWDKQFR